LNLIDLKRLAFTFIEDSREWEDNYLQFYEKNPASRGLYFDAIMEQKQYFVRYAVDEFRCLKSIAGTKKNPLPRLEDIADGAIILISTGLQQNTDSWRELGKALHMAGIHGD
jgi:hypothetical protein